MHGAKFLGILVAGVGFLVGCSDEASPILRSRSTGAYDDDGGVPADGSILASREQPDGGAAPPAPPMSAREFFEKKAFAAVGACTGCHGGGSASAPKFLDGQVGTAYTYLEAHGYIGPESRLLSQGTHGGGSASGLSAENKGVMRQWLALEATERGAKFGKQSLLGRVAECMDETQFRNIGLQTLLTQARPGEDPDYCTGCNQTSCSSCHGDVRTPFYMQLGSALGDDTFAMTKKSPYLGQYITLDGLEPVASRGLEKKQTLVNGQPVYGPHPNFKIRADVKTRLDAFVADTLGKFKQGTCGKAVE